MQPRLIFQGIKNYITGVSDEKIIAMAERRAKVCARCPYLKYSKVHKAGEWFLNKFSYNMQGDIKGTEEFSGFACSLCGCNFKAMITVPEKSCPHIPKKWNQEKL